MYLHWMAMVTLHSPCLLLDWLCRVFYFTRMQVAPKSSKGFSPKRNWTIFSVWSPAGGITAHTSRLHVFLPQFHTMTIKMEGLGVTQSCWIPEPGPLAHAETIISQKGRQGFRQLNKNPLLLFTTSSKPNNNSSGVFAVVVFTYLVFVKFFSLENKSEICMFA